MTTKFQVRKDPHADLHPWQVRNPEGVVVWRTSELENAHAIASMFARRRALQALIHEEGRMERKDRVLAHD